MQMLKTFPSDKITVIKNALFFLSPAPSPHGFTCNAQLLYELKHKVHLCGISHFQIRLLFIKVYIFA